MKQQIDSKKKKIQSWVKSDFMKLKLIIFTNFILLAILIGIKTPLEAVKIFAGVQSSLVTGYIGFIKKDDD